MIRKKLKLCPDAELINQIVNASSRQAPTHAIISPMLTDSSKGKGLFLKRSRDVNEMAKKAVDWVCGKADS